MKDPHMKIDQQSITRITERIRFKLRTKFSVEIDVGEGKKEFQQTPGIYIFYKVTAKTKRGTAYEIADAMPLICTLDDVDAGIVADIIDYRINQTTQLLNEKGV